MPRTHGRIKVEVWGIGSAFRDLDLDQQWVYVMLISQPQISVVGTLAYVPKKWQKLASGLTIERLVAALAKLETDHYSIVDHDTDELLVRTFLKHDLAWRLPNLVTAARRQYLEVESDPIRDYLAGHHPWLVDKTLNARDYEETHGGEPVDPHPSQDTSGYALAHTSPQTSSHTSAHVSEHPSPTHDPTELRVAGAGARNPSPSPSPTPSPEKALSPDSDTETRGGLSFEKEIETTKLLTAIGTDADNGTPDRIRQLAGELNLAALITVRESLNGSKAKDRAAYAIGALRNQIAQMEPRIEATR